MMQFPPSDGSEAATQGRVAPKVQTTSVNNPENRTMRAKRSAIWEKRAESERCPAWRSRVLEGSSAS